MRQAQDQARLSAQQQAHQTAAYEPYGRLSQYGQGITGLTGGVASAQYATASTSKSNVIRIKYGFRSGRPISKNVYAATIN